MDNLRRDPKLAIRYWEEFRSVEIYKRWLAAQSASIYGEVNGTIRYQAPAIKQLYPGANLFLMVRDGRGVVRSIMGWRQFYSPGSKGAYALAPPVDDPFHNEWASMNRFEKICWSWRDANEFLIPIIPDSHWLRLELITSDYAYFTEYFAQRVGIDVDYNTWLAVVSNKSRNATRKYGFPAWSDWSKEQKDSFTRICGETMVKFGYVI